MRVGISSTETDPAGAGAGRESGEMAGAELASEVHRTRAYVVPAIGERRYTVAALDPASSR